LSRGNALLAMLVLLPGVILSGVAHGQCILANPSFELGSGGWNQFGDVGTVSVAAHGSSAARVTGPDYGGWDVSGYWQEMDSEPGEQWEVTVYVQNSPSNPLVGQCSAIVNVEWWSSGGMISYESHAAADASTPTGEYRQFSFTSDPAPSGTVAARLLLGVLQSPTDPPPDVYYDQATFYSLSSPTMDEIQWNDFPGGRTIDFSGRTWRVKGPGWYGPGPSSFSDSPSCVWVDASDQLHMTIKYSGGFWQSTEIALVETLGYGDYIFTTKGRLDLLDPHAVLGLFIWQYGPCYDEGYLWWNPYCEFDIEFSRWNDPGRDLAQFVAQPYDYPGNLSSFDVSFSEDEITSHAFRWTADEVDCRSWRGGPYDESPGNLIHAWTYTGPHIPRPEQPRVHINLWQFDGSPATEQEVVLPAFTFVPEGWTGVSGDPDGPGVTDARAVLSPARPNPFSLNTKIAYTLREPASVEIDIFDVAGRRVRTLVSGDRPAGTHEATWDGRSDRGEAAASGVYFYRLVAGGVRETRRMVLVR